MGAARIPPTTPENIGESLKGLRIADYYTSLFHVSGADISALPKNDVYTGNGRLTGISLSAVGDKVVINRYIEPVGFDIKSEWLDAFHPINSIMLTVTNDNPGNRIAGTKWAPAGGTFLVGEGAGTDQNDPAYSYNFSPGHGGARSGDLAGEYCVTLNADGLPVHTHDVNIGFQTVGSFNTSTQFIFYFGSTVNPQGLTEEKVFSGDNQLLSNVVNNPFPYFLEQDRIEAFQNNTSYNGHDNYRTWLIQQRQVDGYRYTNSDFNPNLGNYSLAGWGGSVTGGPGWGGLLTASSTANSNTQVFVNNGPRPVGVPFTGQNNTGGVLEASVYDPRDNDRVHPGQFGSQDIIRARNVIIDVLGTDEAAIALEGVNLLKELDAEVVNAESTLFTPEQIPGDGVRRSTTNTGVTECHNNILPNYGVYVWRRVPLDFVIPVVEGAVTGVVSTGPGIVTPVAEAMWRGTITTNRKELNLNAWALDRGWNGISPATITINNDVYIWSDSINTPALRIDNFPGGLALFNRGFIMGRGGDGGSYGATTHRRGPHRPVPQNTFRQSGLPSTGWASGIGDGWDGGAAIEINTVAAIVIDNTEGAIAGGGGGGAGGGSGNHGGGGGGAGGGKGGMGSAGGFEAGGAGGAPGRIGGDGANWNNRSGSRPAYQGKGGEAGGGGSGGIKRGGNDPHGGGGGGGRILSLPATGGAGGYNGGGNGGSDGNSGQSVFAKKGGRGNATRGWGNGAGGGGWGADGGDYTRRGETIRTAGGSGGRAIKVISGPVTASGGVVYGKED